MMRALIVEDLERDREFYRILISEIEALECVLAVSAEDALEVMVSMDIELFILDVELPGMNGFLLAEKIRQMSAYRMTPILFITGVSKKQLEAFKQFHCYDYIVKPFGREEFCEKIGQLIKILQEERDKSCKRVKMILYPICSGNIFVPIDQILYAEIIGRQCFLYTELQETPFVSRTMRLKELLSEIGSRYFIQCHKSFAVNVEKIQGLGQVNYRLWEVVLQDQAEKIPVTLKYYRELEQKSGEFLSRWGRGR